MALNATVALSSDQLTDPALWSIRVDIRNDGVEPVRISTATMLAGVSFEVVDAYGGRVPLGPPPTPPSDLGSVTTIEPGASLALEFYGDELLPDAPAPGGYTLRFAAQAPTVEGAWSGAIVSPWVTFDVAARAD